SWSKVRAWPRTRCGAAASPRKRSATSSNAWWTKKTNSLLPPLGGGRVGWGPALGTHVDRRLRWPIDQKPAEKLRQPPGREPLARVRRPARHDPDRRRSTTLPGHRNGPPEDGGPTRRLKHHHPGRRPR